MNLTPSPHWQSFGAHSHEEFITKFVRKSRFHSKVHPEVVEAFETIEALQIHAYWHYKFMDVALAQLMGLFEMAVKLRCKKVGIELKYKDKNDKIRDTSLSVLIDKLVKQELIVDLKYVMHHVRKIRNFSAHRERNDTIGTIARRPILITINLINQIFLPQEDHIETKNELDRFNNEFSFEENELFKLNTDQGLALVYSPKLRNSFKVKNEWIRAISFEPVLQNTFESLSNHKLPKPILHFLKDVSFDDENIKAFDLVSNQPITIERTNKSENIDYFNQHIQELAELKSIDLHSYKALKAQDIDFKIEEYIYTNCWN